jgi:predicted nucleic acid-binding protein
MHQSLRTPDALHLATAQLSMCDGIWTADEGFAKVGAPYVRNVFTD